MEDEFEIQAEHIKALETVREFEVWLAATDNCIEFTNIDPLIEYLTTIDRPEFVMAALDFKREYL